MVIGLLAIKVRASANQEPMEAKSLDKLIVRAAALQQIILCRLAASINPVEGEE